MRILVTNDDGYFADGLKVLATQLRKDHEVYVVAPDFESSNCAHQVTTQTPLVCRQIETHVYSVKAWPADCVRVALHYLKLEVDWVISGINHGGNLGVDIPMSGTCAAAREAAFHGIPAIAVSQVRKSGVEIDWTVATRRAMAVIEAIMMREYPRAGFWNVNLPAVSPDLEIGFAVSCDIDSSPLIVRYDEVATGELKYHGDYHARPRIAGSDVDCCLAGKATYSFVPLML